MKIRVWVRTNRVGSKCERVVDIDDAEWAEMSEQEREDYAKQIMGDMMEWNYEELP